MQHTRLRYANWNIDGRHSYSIIWDNTLALSDNAKPHDAEYDTSTVDRWQRPSCTQVEPVVAINLLAMVSAKKVH